MFLFLREFEAQCSYKIVLIKKECIIRKCLVYVSENCNYEEMSGLSIGNWHYEEVSGPSFGELSL